ncbi:WXG100 family type VII secretion target [Microtetraspora fusca]|uniref:WXG100 family type VII secretion target n=1 Tax=Microtetraspora fusca TaxID=1997 RepID=A0ABW6V564_MICFU|nr:WXG100 family type VII secretion target [Microtetraspora fusca]
MSEPKGAALPQLAALPGGGELAGLLADVTGKPELIRGLATRWSGVMRMLNEQGGTLVAAVDDVDNAWQGASADAFVTHMRKYGPAADELHDALDRAVRNLRKAADALEKAHTDVYAICEGVVHDAEAYAKDHPDASAQKAADDKRALVQQALTSARPHVESADEAVDTALAAVGDLRDHGMAKFSAIKAPGDHAFVPASASTGLGWERTPGYSPEAGSDARTTLASYGGSGGPGNSGGSGGSGGSGSSGGFGGYGPSGPPPPGGGPAAPAEVRAWIEEAVSILKAHGYPASKMNIDDIWMIIQHESGGNPRIVNTDPSDINTIRGTPSKGLMQTIDPTFNAWSLPGHKDIYNPVDNIIAGVRYAIARYGSVSAVPGVVGVKTGAGYQGY